MALGAVREVVGRENSVSRGPFVSEGSSGWWTAGPQEGFPRQRRDGEPVGRLRGLGAALSPAYESGPAGLTLALQFVSQLPHIGQLCFLNFETSPRDLCFV